MSFHNSRKQKKIELVPRPAGTAGRRGSGVVGHQVGLATDASDRDGSEPPKVATGRRVQRGVFVEVVVKGVGVNFCKHKRQVWSINQFSMVVGFFNVGFFTTISVLEISKATPEIGMLVSL